MGGQESDNDKLINSTNGTISYAKVLTSQQPSPKKAPSPSTASTLSSNPSTTPKSSATTAPSQQGKIDKTQWDVAEWFRHGEYWYIDFIKWIFLVSEEKEVSEQ